MRQTRATFPEYRFPGGHDNSAGRWRPGVDIYETPEALVVVMDLAGVAPGALRVDATRGVLTVTGARSRLAHPDVQRIHRMEIPQGEFEVTVDLPAAVDPQDARATIREGLLEIYLPLLAAFRPVVAGHGAERAR